VTASPPTCRVSRCQFANLCAGRPDIVKVRVNPAGCSLGLLRALKGRRHWPAWQGAREPVVLGIARLPEPGKPQSSSGSPASAGERLISGPEQRKDLNSVKGGCSPPDPGVRDRLRGMAEREPLTASGLRAEMRENTALPSGGCFPPHRGSAAARPHLDQIKACEVGLLPRVRAASDAPGMREGYQRTPWHLGHSGRQFRLTQLHSPFGRCSQRTCRR
jgi:hypothetical protein